MLIRSDMSRMSVLSGRRASVESFPVWWNFPHLRVLCSAGYDVVLDACL